MYELIALAPQADRALSVAQMCHALALSRATYYRCRAAVHTPRQAVERRDQIPRMALEFPMYGYRRVTHELRRRGVMVKHKHVQRLMRKDNLLCLRTRGFLHTTNTQHALFVYPNVVPELTVSGPDP